MTRPARTILLFMIGLGPAAAAETLSAEGIGRDYRLYVTAWQADIDMQAADNDQVIVTSECVPPDEPLVSVDGRGLRVVSREGAVPELRKSDDRVTYTIGEAAGDCRIAISAPPTLETLVRINDKGTVSVGGWRAMLTAWSAGGNVILRDQQGPFSITAMNGDARIEYRGATLQADSAATAANGIVALDLGGEPALTLRTQARWGKVATNLDAKFVREQREEATWSVARLAGGGPVVTLRNLNSDIVITGKSAAD